jgi:hypothetical protein
MRAEVARHDAEIVGGLRKLVMPGRV